MEQRKKLGEIFVTQGVLTEKTVERMLARAQKINRRFGVILEELGLITGEELAEALAIQYGYRIIRNLPHIAIPPEILALVPLGVAMENKIIPLKRDKDMLAMAMVDPTDSRVTGNLAADLGLRVVPFIAPRQDLLDTICLRYLGKPPVHSRTKTVLVVEDDKLVQTMFENILIRAGYSVITAQDGMEAFKAVIAGKPHVIITDKEMPKLDGFGFLAALQNLPETRGIPVILVTGKMLNAEEEAKAFDKGFFDFITKPVSEVTLLARVKRAYQAFEAQELP